MTKVNVTARDYVKNEIEKRYAEELRAIVRSVYAAEDADRMEKRFSEAAKHRDNMLEAISKIDFSEMSNVNYWNEES